MDRLTDYAFLKENILIPALAYSVQRQLITQQEQEILLEVVKLGTAKSGDLAKALHGLKPAQRTYQIKRLVDRKMLQPIQPGARQYSLCFTNNYLLRGAIHALTNEGFISASLRGPM